MPIPFQELWLIVAGEDDQVAQSLTSALRIAGERAILVDTPDMIRMYASERTICVIVFSHTVLSPATLTAALELRFVAHIPIVAGDGGELPRGPWTGQPLVAQTVDAALVAQLQDRLHEGVATGAAGAIERDLAAPPPLPQTKSERKQRRLRYLLIARIISIGLIALFSIGTIQFSHHATSSYTYRPPPTYPLGVGYSVHVPGTCDNTPTVIWYITGKNAVQCRQDGIVMERDDLQYSDFTKFSVNEDKPEQYFGTSYNVQATMQFLRSDKTTCMGIDILEQSGDNLGSISFYICGDDHWEVDFFNPSGVFYSQISTGVLAHPQTAYTMHVSLQDAVMIMQLNGKMIVKAIDPGYVTTSSVALVTSDIGNSSVISQALFSDFSVQPGTTAN